jgi:hypothetical protein
MSATDSLTGVEEKFGAHGRECQALGCSLARAIGPRAFVRIFPPILPVARHGGA